MNLTGVNTELFALHMPKKVQFSKGILEACHATILIMSSESACP